MSPGTAAAWVVLAGAAAWLLSGRDEALRRARWVTGAREVAGVGVAGAGPAGPGPTAVAWGPPRPAWGRYRGAFSSGWRRLADGPRGWAGEVGCVVAGAAVALLSRSPLPALAGVAAVPLVRRWLRRRAGERQAARRRAGVVELCSGLAGELRTGRPPQQVLAEAVEDSPWMTGPGLSEAAVGVLAAARFGGDVPAALRRAAGAPGAEGLAGVAACWQVAVDRGCGLAEGVERVGAALREQQRLDDELRAELAGPRSTAALLAALPMVGLLLGTALEAQPLRVLLHTPAGLGCLVLGAVLQGLGLAWTARIVRRAAA
ncbi:type II secretion system F family protein [Wenjunlia vitaminophila]|uniref:type II secretion system F family protein n=1 Tax=Wenjunlia vitaminophila TaxID=76728 RepID=UPI00036A4D36|nr:type II secretion system F family protein [Wenjunlia vitaminophila]